MNQPWTAAVRPPRTRNHKRPSASMSRAAASDQYLQPLSVRYTPSDLNAVIPEQSKALSFFFARQATLVPHVITTGHRANNDRNVSRHVNRGPFVEMGALNLREALGCLQDGFDQRLLIGSISAEIPHIQKPALETDIDEGCLHTWHKPERLDRDKDYRHRIARVRTRISDRQPGRSRCL